MKGWRLSFCKISLNFSPSRTSFPLKFRFCLIFNTQLFLVNFIVFKMSSKLSSHSWMKNNSILSTLFVLFSLFFPLFEYFFMVFGFDPPTLNYQEFCMKKPKFIYFLVKFSWEFCMELLNFMTKLYRNKIFGNFEVNDKIDILFNETFFLDPSHVLHLHGGDLTV